jgi:hypothetical protein
MMYGTYQPNGTAKANENKIVGALGLFSLIVFDAFIGC